MFSKVFFLAYSGQQLLYIPENMIKATFLYLHKL